MRRISLYRSLAFARMRAQWQYRTSFVIDTVGSVFFSLFELLTLLAIVRHVPSLNGWSIADIAFLFGTSGLGFAIADLFVGHIENLGSMIRSGTFDSILLRPAGSLLQMLAIDLSLRRIGRIITTAAVLAVSMTLIDVEWTFARALMTVLTVLSASLIFASLFILWSTLQFWVVGSAEIANAFTYGGSYITHYPLDVLAPWLRRLLTWVVPLAFVSWLPAMYVLGRDDQPVAMQLLSPAIAILLSILSVVAWSRGVRHYRSTGS